MEVEIELEDIIRGGDITPTPSPLSSDSIRHPIPLSSDSTLPKFSDFSSFASPSASIESDKDSSDEIFGISENDI